ncbi:MAG: Mov34/MPN/PAD-1 family protein [Chloroflexi bacterium]|nr:Mov34/MPN/PAD-1 family protein [Chloroflexota bacterium]
MNHINVSKNTKVYGHPDKGHVVITIDKKAHDAVYVHGLLNPNQEVGGLFVGNVTQDENGKHYVDIVAAVAAESAPGTRTRMQFTGPVWLEMLDKVQNGYPGLRVVGWYHTHPNMGVFLSDDDVTAHKVAFSNPWHVAAVCDPLKRQMGFFSWKGEELRSVEGFYVKESNIGGQTDGKYELPDPLKASAYVSTNRTAIVVIPLLCIIFILIGLTVFFALRQSPNQNKPDPAIAQAFTSGAETCSYVQSNKLFTYFVHNSGRIQMVIEDLDTGKLTLQSQVYSIPELSRIIRVSVHEADIGGPKQGYLVIESEQLQSSQSGPVIVSAMIESSTGKLTALNRFSVSPDTLNFGANEKGKNLEISATDANGINNPRWVINPDEQCRDWISLNDQASGYVSKKLAVSTKSDQMQEGINAGNLIVSYGPEDWNIRLTVPVQAEKETSRVITVPEDKIRVTRVGNMVSELAAPGVDPSYQISIWVKNIDVLDYNNQPPTITIIASCLNTGCWMMVPLPKNVMLQRGEEREVPYSIRRAPGSQCTELPRLNIRLIWNLHNEYQKDWEVSGAR